MSVPDRHPSQSRPSASVQELFAELEAEGPMVGIVLGDEGHRSILLPAAAELSRRGISFEFKVLTPVDPRGVAEYSSTAVLRGLRVLICATAGGNLAGTVAAYTELPVIGVPVRTEALNGLDAVLATVQMPDGVPVGCMAVDGSRNAAIYAAKILAQGLPGNVLAAAPPNPAG